MPPKLGECISGTYEINVDGHAYPLMCHNQLNNRAPKQVTVKRFIFNKPATIAIFSDGTKSVVKTQGKDVYDPEKGAALAVAKRFLSKKDYHTMLLSVGVMQIYEALGVEGEVTVDAKKHTVKHTGKK